MPLSEMFRRSLARTVEMLRATGREVVLVAGTPEIGWPVPMTLLNHARFDRAVPPAPDLAEVRDRNAPIRAIFDDLARDPGVRVVTLDDVLCTPDCAVEAPMRGTGAAREGGYPLYVDDNHVSASAARELLAPALAARIWPGEQEAGLAPGPPSLPDLPATRPDRSFDAQP